MNSDDEGFLLSTDESGVGTWGRFVEGGYLELWQSGSESTPDWELALSAEETIELLKHLVQRFPLEAMGVI